MIFLIKQYKKAIINALRGKTSLQISDMRFATKRKPLGFPHCIKSELVLSMVFLLLIGCNYFFNNKSNKKGNK